MSDNKFSNIEIIDTIRGIAAVQAPESLLGGEDTFALSKIIGELDNQTVHILAIDVSKVLAINSSGLGILIAANRLLSSKNIQFTLVNPSQKVQEILSMTHLDKVFHFANDLSAL
ncbi:MAG: STAS domain-containing protein [Chloroherpetonaceae bacterium]